MEDDARKTRPLLAGDAEAGRAARATGMGRAVAVGSVLTLLGLLSVAGALLLLPVARRNKPPELLHAASVDADVQRLQQFKDATFSSSGLVVVAGERGAAHAPDASRQPGDWQSGRTCQPPSGRSSPSLYYFLGCSA